MRHSPQRISPSSSTGPCSSQRRSYSRTAWTPPPRSTRFEPAGEREQLGERRRQRLARVERAEDVLVGGGMQAAEEREHLVADQAALRVGVARVDAERRGPRLGSTSTVSSRQTVEQRPHDAVVAPRRSIPVAVPRETSR